MLVLLLMTASALRIELQAAGCTSQSHCSTWRPWVGVRMLSGEDEARADNHTWLVLRRAGDASEVAVNCSGFGGDAWFRPSINGAPAGCNFFTGRGSGVNSKCDSKPTEQAFWVEEWSDRGVGSLVGRSQNVTLHTDTQGFAGLTFLSYKATIRGPAVGSGSRS